MILAILSAILHPALAFAVSCGAICVPPVCTPVAPATSCVSTCSYSACNSSNTLSITVDKIPYTISIPADSCAPGEFSPNPITTISTSVNGASITKISQPVSITYSICGNATASQTYP